MLANLNEMLKESAELVKSANSIEEAVSMARAATLPDTNPHPTVAVRKNPPAAKAPSNGMNSGKYKPVGRLKPSDKGDARYHTDYANRLTKKAVFASNKHANTERPTTYATPHIALATLHNNAKMAHTKAAEKHTLSAAEKEKAGQKFAADMHKKTAAGHTHMAGKHADYASHHMDKGLQKIKNNRDSGTDLNKTYQTYKGQSRSDNAPYHEVVARLGDLRSVLEMQLRTPDAPAPSAPSSAEVPPHREAAIAASKKALASQHPPDHLAAADAHRKAAAHYAQAKDMNSAQSHIKMALLHKNRTAGQKYRVGEDFAKKYDLGAVLECVAEFEALPLDEALVVGYRSMVASAKVGSEKMEAETATSLKIPTAVLLQRRQAHLASHDALKSGSEKDHKHAAKLHSDLAQHFHKEGHHGLATHHLDMAYNHVEAGMSSPASAKAVKSAPRVKAAKKSSVKPAAA